MKLQLLGETKLDFSAIPMDDEERLEYDKVSNKANEKFTYLSKKLMKEDHTLKHYHLLFYFELPQDLIDSIINEHSVSINFVNDGHLAKGFFSGNVESYARLIAYSCREGANQRLRLFGNLLFGYLKGKYPILQDRSVKLLHDKTFALVTT